MRAGHVGCQFGRAGPPASLSSAVMREYLLILSLSALMGCSAPHATASGVWSEDRQALAKQTTLFDPASSTLNAEARTNAAAVAHYMKTNTGVAVRIEGHGDGEGTEAQNLKLASGRAQALREELLREGVDAARVDTKACGKKVRKDPYLSPAPRKCRCADFVLLVPPP